MPARDVVLTDSTGSLPLTLYDDPKRGKHIRTSWDPPSGGPRDQVYFDGKNGYGYSQPGIVTDGYAYATNDSNDYGPGIDARSPGTFLNAGAITEMDVTSATLGGTIGPITDSFYLNGHIWLLAGRYALKVDSGTGGPNVAHDFGVGAVMTNAALAKYAGVLYAWIGHTTPFALSKFDGTTWTTTTSLSRGPLTTVYWATTDGVSVQRLVGADSDSTVTHVPLTSDPFTAANWSAPIKIGDQLFPIGTLVAASRHVFVSTTGGVYDIDDLQQTVNLTPYHVDASAEANNGQVCGFHNGRVLYSTLNGLDAIDVSQSGIRHDTATWVLPGANMGIPNETPIWGWVTALTIDSGWVVASVFNNVDSYIVYGKPRALLGFAGPGEWIWHGALAKYANQRVTHLKARTVTQAGALARRLWTATVPYNSTVGARLFWQSVPRSPSARQDSLNATAHRFGTTGSLYLTPANWGTPGKQHAVTQGAFDSRSLTGTSNTLALSVAVDDGSFGSTLVTSNTSPIDRFPLAASAIQGGQVSPKVVFVGTATVPSVMKSLTLSAGTDPASQEVWEFDVVFARETELNSGARTSHATPERDYAILADMQSTLVTLVGPTGDTYTMLLETALPGDWFQADSQDRDGTRSWVRKVTVRGRIVDQPSRYGESALYGARTYS